MPTYSPQQIKTSRGQLVPKKAVRLEDPSAFSFEFYTPEELAQLDEIRQVPLEDLALCKTSERSLEIAQASGPLFGTGNHESTASWSYAITAANTIVRIQQIINAKLPLDAVTELGQRISCSYGQKHAFNIYSLTLQVGSAGAEEYLRTLDTSMLYKSFRMSGSYDYALFSWDEEASAHYLTVTILSFAREISASDFLAALSTCFQPESAEYEAVRQEIESSDDFASGLRAGIGLADSSKQFVSREVELGPEDYPQVQHLVYAFISLHLSRAIFDMFQATQDDDFLIFPNYLASMYHRFGQQLKELKIGYCQQCGQGFSLAGHRGIPRRFCGDACRTKFKNERSKQTRDQVRRLFLSEGMQIDEIAQTVYINNPEMQTKSLKVARRKIMADLEDSKELRARLLEDTALFDRCLKEGFFSTPAGKKRLETLLQKSTVIKEHIKYLSGARRS